MGSRGSSPDRYLNIWRVARVRWLAVDTAHFECYAFVTIACMYTLQPNEPPLGSEARGTLDAMEPPKTCQDQWLAWQTFPSLPRRPPLGSEGRDCLNILGHTKTSEQRWPKHSNLYASGPRSCARLRLPMLQIVRHSQRIEALVPIICCAGRQRSRSPVVI